MKCVDGCDFIGNEGNYCRFYGMDLRKEKGIPYRCIDCIEDEARFRNEQFLKETTEVFNK